MDISSSGQLSPCLFCEDYKTGCTVVSKAVQSHTPSKPSPHQYIPAAADESSVQGVVRAAGCGCKVNKGGESVRGTILVLSTEHAASMCKQQPDGASVCDPASMYTRAAPNRGDMYYFHPVNILFFIFICKQTTCVCSGTPCVPTSCQSPVLPVFSFPNLLSEPDCK